jgi:hypothetical protein
MDHSSAPTRALINACRLSVRPSCRSAGKPSNLSPNLFYQGVVELHIQPSGRLNVQAWRCVHQSPSRLSSQGRLSMAPCIKSNRCRAQDANCDLLVMFLTEQNRPTCICAGLFNAAGPVSATWSEPACVKAGYRLSANIRSAAILLTVQHHKCWNDQR